MTQKIEGPFAVGQVLEAAAFAARKHRDQRRKDAAASPYINHPLDVANVLIQVGGVRDAELIVAALLHDTVEDTDTTFEELERHFGVRVSEWVREVTDDKTLPKGQRKALQIDHAPHLSPGAKQIKLADKSCNLHDLIHNPPRWSVERRRKYVIWASEVVAGLRGVNLALEAHVDAVLTQARVALGDGNGA